MSEHPTQHAIEQFASALERHTVEYCIIAGIAARFFVIGGLDARCQGAQASVHTVHDTPGSARIWPISPTVATSEPSGCASRCWHSTVPFAHSTAVRSPGSSCSEPAVIERRGGGVADIDPGGAGLCAVQPCRGSCASATASRRHRSGRRGLSRRSKWITGFIDRGSNGHDLDIQS